MKIAYMSDLHTDMHMDFGKSFMNTLQVPECDVLVIAGDLMQANTKRWKESVRKLADMAPYVIYVLGNHEYYETSWQQLDNSARILSQQIKNLRVVGEAESFEIAGTTFLAGTMWFPNDPYNGLYARLMSDFRYIKDFTPEVYERNTRFHDRLDDVLHTPRAVIITHHLPTEFVINHKFKGSALNRFFVGGELYNDIAGSKLGAWIFGHGHDPVLTKIGNTLVTSNPFGYPNETRHNWKVEVASV